MIHYVEDDDTVVIEEEKKEEEDDDLPFDFSGFFMSSRGLFISRISVSRRLQMMLRICRVSLKNQTMKSQ